jgi:transposase-like protein
VSELALQLGVSRKSIYQWRNRYRLGGSKALRGRGRMTNADLSAHERRPAAEKQPDKEARQTLLEELARAQRRISMLERKIGQQQVELDFFQRPCGKSGISACGAACRRGLEPGISQRLCHHHTPGNVSENSASNMIA